MSSRAPGIAAAELESIVGAGTVLNPVPHEHLVDEAESRGLSGTAGPRRRVGHDIRGCRGEIKRVFDPKYLLKPGKKLA